MMAKSHETVMGGKVSSGVGIVLWQQAAVVTM
jgi:hypothetical protein